MNYFLSKVSLTLRWFMNGLLSKRFHPLLDGLCSTMTAAAALRTFLCHENPPNIQQHHRPTPSSWFFQKQIGKQNENYNKFKVSPSIQQHQRAIPRKLVLLKEKSENKTKVSQSIQQGQRPTLF